MQGAHSSPKSIQGMATRKRHRRASTSWNAMIHWGGKALFLPSIADYSNHNNQCVWWGFHHYSRKHTISPLPKREINVCPGLSKFLSPELAGRLTPIHRDQNLDKAEWNLHSEITSHILCPVGGLVLLTSLHLETAIKCPMASAYLRTWEWGGEQPLKKKGNVSDICLPTLLSSLGTIQKTGGKEAFCTEIG